MAPSSHDHGQLKRTSPFRHRSDNLASLPGALPTSTQLGQPATLPSPCPFRPSTSPSETDPTTLHGEAPAKLLRALYAGAVPLDLLKIEQDRIAQEIKEAQKRISATELHYKTSRTRLTGLLA
jgi:hypothetical protein